MLNWAKRKSLSSTLSELLLFLLCPLPWRGWNRKIEHVNDELGSLLRRLGVSKGAHHLRSAIPVKGDDRSSRYEDATPPSLEVLLPGGRLLGSADGACFVVDHVFPLHYRHGADTLADLLAVQPAAGAPYISDDRLNGHGFGDFLFLDTETTGLAGAGALAFMVGVAFFEPQTVLTDGIQVERQVLVVRQYFLRDHGDEPAMLRQLDDLLAGKAGLITFNGRSFDVPLLDNRYLMNRLRGRLPEMPHIDLLLPARRLFRARLGSCALGALEQNLLGLQRTHDDVPGWLIPSLYHNFLRTGDARELTRVFYHNEMDMLSMVTLAARMFRHMTTCACDDALDQVSLGRWQIDLGLFDEAERALRATLENDATSLDAYQQALSHLGALYKRTERRPEAVLAWQQLAAVSTGDVSAHVELAKHYEWHASDTPTAMEWTRRALALIDRLPLTPNTRLTRAELTHRLLRLEKKAR